MTRKNQVTTTVTNKDENEDEAKARSERFQKLLDRPKEPKAPAPKLIWVCKSCGSRDLGMTESTAVTGMIDQSGTSRPTVDREIYELEECRPEIRCLSCGAAGNETQVEGRPDVSVSWQFPATAECDQ